MWKQLCTVSALLIVTSSPAVTQDRDGGRPPLPPGLSAFSLCLQDCRGDLQTKDSLPQCRRSCWNQAFPQSRPIVLRDGRSVVATTLRDNRIIVADPNYADSVLIVEGLPPTYPAMERTLKELWQLVKNGAKDVVKWIGGDKDGDNTNEDNDTNQDNDKQTICGVEWNGTGPVTNGGDVVVNVTCVITSQ